MQVPIISGIYTDTEGEYRSQYPRNMTPIPKQQGISNGYLRPSEGIVHFADTCGRDRDGINWNGVQYRVIGSNLCIVREDGKIVVAPANETKRARQMWGMSRTQVANLVTGVTDGFVKKLEINGVGYCAQVQGKVLKLSLGYSHDVNFDIPQGIEIKTPKPTEIEITGTDQQQV